MATWLALAAVGVVVLGLSGCGSIVQSPTSAAVNAGGLTVNPSSVSFGSVAVGQTASASVALSNGGTTTVQVTQISVSGTGFEEVSSDTLPLNIGPGDSYNVAVSFAPASSGAASGQITVASSAAGGGTITVGMSGTGTAASSGTATLLNGLSCSYGAMTGSGSDNCTVTLNSAAPSGGLAVDLSSNNSSIVVPASVTVGANANRATFKATVSAVSAAQTGTLTASATGVNETFSLKLNAADRVLSTNLASLSFGDVTVNTSEDKTLVLQSTGTEALTISAASLSGTGFALSGGSFPITLNPNSVVELQVQFAPSSAGSATGQLTITSNSTSGTTLQVDLSGTGTAGSSSSSGTGAILSVNSTTVAFGSVALNTPATQSVTLSSTGTSAVTVSSATVTGTGFTFAGGAFPITLNPGQSAVLNVVFTPASAAAATGQLSIASNSTTGAITVVALTGAGVSTATYVVDLTWNAPVSSADPVVGYNVYRATGTGASFQLLNGSVNVPTTFADAGVQSGGTYVYAVTSVDASGVESSDSNLFTVTIP
ncbi:MAG TPA: choice-of-anchor D domain-containing protein [Acidobacteriaceae bacterium]|nr:choice-of-anchor D domain-containing protein [Acidobacteriaceae bacterium]